MGIQVVLKALSGPLRQIVNNAGGDASVVHQVRSEKGNYGYNAADDTYGDMVKMGIIDPTKVTKTALENAASIAGMLIITSYVITDEPKAEAECWRCSWCWRHGRHGRHGWHGRHDVVHASPKKPANAALGLRLIDST